VADKASQTVVAGLERALAEPLGLPLHGGKGELALFPSSAGGKQAAQRSLDEGHLHIVRTESRGKSNHTICKLTDKGVNYLLSQIPPAQVLEDLTRAIEARQAQVADLLRTVRQLSASLDDFKTVTQRVLMQVQPVAAWKTHLLQLVEGWRGQSSEDCPLPELYRQLLPAHPDLTIGQFHDELRALHDAGHLYLHPWPGPLYDLPEPQFALLVGHVIAYYVSKR